MVKAAWISGSRAKVSLSREDGVGMGSLGLPITDLGRATRGKVVVRDIRGSVGCVEKLVTRRRSGGVEAVEEEEVVADVGGVWTIASVEKGRTKAKGWHPPTKKEAALRRRSKEVAFVHKNKFGVLEVDCGDLAVYAVEVSAQVHELDVAQVSTEITIESAAEESVCRKSGPSHLGSKLWTGL